ncbi:MAG: T9SS type A sorting domain-containing protein [Saprospiraceae bacterium]
MRTRVLFLVLIISIALCPTTWAQRDAISIFGYQDSLSAGYGLSELDFSGRQAKLEYFGPSPRADKLYWMGEGSALSNPTGTLLLYSGGCDIREANGRQIPGTQPLVEDDLTLNCIASSMDRWPGEIILPAPDSWGDSVAYMLVHNLSIPGHDTTVKSTGVTALRVARRRGQYTLTERIPVGNHSSYASTQMTAYPAPESIGGGWWLPLIEHDSNRWHMYRVAGVDESWTAFTSSTTGPKWRTSQIFENEIKFSPDGNFLALNGGNPGLTIYDFNALTGSLNFLFTVPSLTPEETGYGGAAWSSNSRHLYFGCPEDSDAQVCVLDMNIARASNDPSVAVTKIGRINSSEGIQYRNWPYAFGEMWLAPDCRIYVNPSASNFNIHIIEHPNRGGHDAGLVINAVDAPTRFSVDGFISFPNYRATSGCDSTIAPIEGAISNNLDLDKPQTGLTIYPNPAGHFATVGHLPTYAKVSLVGVSGETFMNLTPNNKTERDLDLRRIPTGVYFVVVVDPITKATESIRLVIGPEK